MWHPQSGCLLTNCINTGRYKTLIGSMDSFSTNMHAKWCRCFYDCCAGPGGAAAAAAAEQYPCTPAQTQARSHLLTQ